MAEGLKAREHTLEEKFHQKELTNFKSIACAHRLFALKMASCLGYNEADTEYYVDTLLMTYLKDPSLEMLLKKVREELHQAEIFISEQQLRHELSHCYQKALKAIQ